MDSLTNELRRQADDLYRRLAVDPKADVAKVAAEAARLVPGVGEAQAERMLFQLFEHDRTLFSRGSAAMLNTLIERLRSSRGASPDPDRALGSAAAAETARNGAGADSSASSGSRTAPEAETAPVRAKGKKKLSERAASPQLPDGVTATGSGQSRKGKGKDHELAAPPGLLPTPSAKPDTRAAKKAAKVAVSTQPAPWKQSDGAVSTGKGAKAGQPSIDEVECPICLEGFSGNAQLGKKVTLDCRHQFHDDCMNRWFASTGGAPGAASCPICRKPALSKDEFPTLGGGGPRHR